MMSTTRTRFLALAPDKVYHLDGTPNTDEPDWDDVHRTLSRIHRFGGRSPYSVLDHAFAVRHALILLEAPSMAVHHGFFHDHHESLVGDVPYPIGQALGNAWEKVHSEAQAYMRRWFDWGDLTSDDAQLVHDIDVAATYVEALLSGVARPTCPWVAKYATGSPLWWGLVSPLLREGYETATIQPSYFETYKPSPSWSATRHSRFTEAMKHLNAIPRTVSS